MSATNDSKTADVAAADQPAVQPPVKQDVIAFDWSDPASPKTKAAVAAKLVWMEGLRSQYIDAVKTGQITIDDGAWIAVYGPNDYKIAKTWQEAIGDRQDDCYCVQHNKNFEVPVSKVF